MIPVAQTILDKYQVRKTNTQKQAFIDFLKTELPELTIQKSQFPNNKNLILGEIENSNILLTAHYDTCAQLPIPNFITPLNPLLSIAYSLLLVIPLFIIILLKNTLPAPFSDVFGICYWLALLLCFGIGPANPHTVNDNTSGVIMLLEIYAALTEEERQTVSLIFFDNEEKGLIGSSILRKKYKKELDTKLLVNFDCVSDGNAILLAISKKARNLNYNFEAAYQSTTTKQFLIKKAEKVYYPSDQANFPNAVAVAALKHKNGLGYYMDRIHTKKDTVMDEENIRVLKECTINLIRQSQ